MFIGGAGSGFGKLHWDFSYLHVYISQVRGSKDFIIFAPEDSPYLYPNPEYLADSLIKNLNDFDIEKYPDVNKATPIRFTVHDGETVFLPGGWWHATKMHGLSISVAESTLDRANWKVRSGGGSLPVIMAGATPGGRLRATKPICPCLGGWPEDVG